MSDGNNILCKGDYDSSTLYFIRFKIKSRCTFNIFRETIFFDMLKETFNISTIRPSPFAFMCPVNFTWNIGNISILLDERKNHFIKETFSMTARCVSHIIIRIQSIYCWSCAIIKHLFFRQNDCI